MAGNRAYRLHVTGIRLSEAGNQDKAQENFTQALKAYETAMEKGCTTVRTLMAYGVLLMRSGQFEKAQSVMLKTQKLKGLTADDTRRLGMNYAVCQWKLDHLDDAIARLKRIYQDGKNSTLYGSLGYMLIEKAIQTGDFSEARAFNDEAYEYDPDDAVTLDNMGQLAYVQGDIEGAKAYFLHAHEVKPTQADTLYYLAKIAHEQGNSDTARDYINRCLKLNPSALSTTSKEQAQALSKEIIADEQEA